MVEAKRTHRRDRVARRFVFFLLLLGLLALFAPTIVGSTGLRQWALDRAVPASIGKLTARGANLNWWSPVSLAGVQFTDPAGTVVFKAESVQVDRSLWRLATNASDLGVVRVDRPMAALMVREDGSNVEDLIALLAKETATADPQPDGVEASSQPPVQIEITNGAIQMVEAFGAQRSWVVDELNASVNTASAIPSVTASAIVYAGTIDTAAAPVRAAGQVAPPRDGGTLRITNNSDAGGQHLALQVERMPITPLEPWLKRFDSKVKLAGTITGSGGVQWRPVAGGAGPDRAAALLQSGLVTSGTLAAERLAIEATPLGDRPMRLAQARLPWRVRATADGRLAVEQLHLTSELGDVKLRSNLDYPELAALLAGDWSAPRTAAIESDLDLAQLARVAPGAVRLRPGTAIQAGRIRATFTSQPAGAGQPTGASQLSGTLNTTDITALAGGRVVEWNRPLVVRATGTRIGRDVQIDKLNCESEFLDIDASINGQQVAAEMTFDLDRLTQQLGRFIDLTGWRLSGRGSSKLSLARPAADQFRGVADVDLTGATFATPDRVLLNEERLVARLEAAGQHDANWQPTRIDAADVRVQAGGDTLAIKTTGPVAADGTTPIDAQLAGSLENWFARLRLLAPDRVKGLTRLAGNANVSAVGIVGADRFAFSNFNLRATGFELNGPGLRVREDQVEARGSLMFDSRASRLTSQEFQFVSNTAAVRGRDLNVAWGTGPQRAPSGGRVVTRVDLARLNNWFAVSRAADAIQPAGVVDGELRLAEQNGRISATLNLNSQQVALRQANTVLWQSPSMKITGQAAYAPNLDQLTFQDLRIESAALRGSVTGQVNQLQTNADAQLNGAIDYDLRQWASVIAARLGPGFQIAARDQAVFQLSGPLRSTSGGSWTQRLTGRVEAPWQSAVAYGLPIGPGRLKLALSQGVVRADPLVVALGGTTAGDSGRLTIQPAVRLDPAPSEFGLPAGPVLTNVQITPQISEEMLKYFAPVMAGATRSEGVFSLSTTGARAPLADLKRMEVSGQLAVQSVRVVPGPNTEQWVSLARQIESLANGGDLSALLGGGGGVLPTRQPTLLSIDDRTVNYRVTAGRVYHEPMTFRVGNVPVQSSGSVGFDETLNLQLSVPIQDQWVEGKPLLASLRGQSVVIPVQGTFSNPRIDRSALRNLSQQLLRDAPRNAIGNEIGRFLDRALGN